MLCVWPCDGFDRKGDELMITTVQIEGCYLRDLFEWWVLNCNLHPEKIGVFHPDKFGRKTIFSPINTFGVKMNQNH